MNAVLPHTRRRCSNPTHSDREWQDIITAQGHRCFYCSKLVSVDDKVGLTKDHLHPLCTGGCDCCGNLVGACGACNSMKRHMTVLEFLHARPSFLMTMGEFSTRVLVLNREAYFWARLKPEIRNLALRKRMDSVPVRFLKTEKKA